MPYKYVKDRLFKGPLKLSLSSQGAYIIPMTCGASLVSQPCEPLCCWTSSFSCILPTASRSSVLSSALALAHEALTPLVALLKRGNPRGGNFLDIFGVLGRFLNSLVSKPCFLSFSTQNHAESSGNYLNKSILKFFCICFKFSELLHAKPCRII